jgi:DNA-binding NarL/FixJ family response regulator
MCEPLADAASAIRVLVVDDHPAMRAGLTDLLADEPGMEPTGAVGGTDELWPALRRLAPDVVVLDYALAAGDGLTACFRVKQRPGGPRVVLYTAYADAVFAVPAAVAQADAVVSKSAPVSALLGAIRRVHAGETLRPRVEPALLEAAAARIDAGDLPVAGMLLERVAPDEIARTLGVHPAEVRARAGRIIGRMQPRRAEVVP